MPTPRTMPIGITKMGQSEFTKSLACAQIWEKSRSRDIHTSLEDSPRSHCIPPGSGVYDQPGKAPAGNYDRPPSADFTVFTINDRIPIPRTMPIGITKIGHRLLTKVDAWDHTSEKSRFRDMISSPPSCLQTLRISATLSERFD